MKKAGPSGWRGVMNRRPQPSDFGLSPLADNVDALTQRDPHKPRIPRLRHGVGGGMRFADDHELRRLSLGLGTGDVFGRQLSLTTPRVVAGIYCAVLLTILMVSHIHLRFQIHDLKMQEHALQTVQRQLDRRISVLDRGVASRLGDLGPMREAALHHLNMVRADQATELVIAPHIAQKYSPEAVASVMQAKEADGATETAALQQRNSLMRLADFAIAFIPSN